MYLASLAFVGLVAVLHVFFLVLEMFLWTTPRGLKTFNMTQSQANETARLAKNQGLYNGFLAAGLFWSLLASDPHMAIQLKTFFLGCVAVAGFYGAATVSPRILLVQSTPALIALALTWLSSRGAG